MVPSSRIATERIAQGHFEIELPHARTDEIGQPGSSINQLSAQLSRFVTVKSCIDACRGEIRCRNRQPTGLEVEIRLPAAP